MRRNVKGVNKILVIKESLLMQQYPYTGSSKKTTEYFLKFHFFVWKYNPSA